MSEKAAGCRLRLLDTHKYGFMVIGMKTTVELPDNLLIEAKKKAAELRRPLKSLIEEGLRSELQMLSTAKPRKKKEINGDETIIIADLKREALEQVRHHDMRYFLPNRRPDIYG